jgi:uncharacterized protein
VLLVVDTGDHDVRIQTGTVLNSRIPDSTASAIIQSQILPHFRADNYDAGVVAGIDALSADVGLPTVESLAGTGGSVSGSQPGTPTISPRTRSAVPNSRPNAPAIIGGLAFFVVLVAALVFSTVMRRGRAQRGWGPTRVGWRRGNLPRGPGLWAAEEASRNHQPPMTPPPPPPADFGGGSSGGGGATGSW